MLKWISLPLKAATTSPALTQENSSAALFLGGSLLEQYFIPKCLPRKRQLILNCRVQSKRLEQFNLVQIGKSPVALSSLFVCVLVGDEGKYNKNAMDCDSGRVVKLMGRNSYVCMRRGLRKMHAQSMNQFKQSHCLPHRQKQEIGGGEISTFQTFAKLRLLGWGKGALLLYDSPTMECRLPWQPFQGLLVQEMQGLYGLRRRKEKMCSAGTFPLCRILDAEKFKGFFFEVLLSVLNRPSMQHPKRRNVERHNRAPQLSLTDVAIYYGREDLITHTSSCQ